MYQKRYVMKLKPPPSLSKILLITGRKTTKVILPSTHRLVERLKQIAKEHKERKKS